MSIYNRTVESLSSSDLGELLTEKAVENVRLEFKREAPRKDETLKKLSSFANTFGGYLVIGGDADSTDGRLKALPGISPETGFKQRIIQWCYDGASPPITAFVSDPLTAPSDSQRVCYVVYVSESGEAPHFLNGRKGVYVRTDEFSQRFEACLATYGELVHLINRRAVAVERRKALRMRAEERFETHVTIDYSSDRKTEGSIAATAQLFICPLFPTTALIEERALPVLLRETTIRWRGVGFPSHSAPISQQESALLLQPTSAFSLFEATTWGSLFYAYEIEHTVGQATGIHLSSFGGHLLAFLQHARAVYQRYAYEGTLSLQLHLKRVRGQPWVYFLYGFPEFGPASKLDDAVTISLEVPTGQLVREGDEVAKELLRSALFALNWADAAANDTSIATFLDQAYKYNSWT